MRQILLALGLCFALAFPGVAATNSSLELRKDTVFAIKDGKRVALPEHMNAAQPVDGAAMKFAGLGEEASEAFGLAAGIYLFKGDGKPVAFIPMEYGDMCATVALSPDGGILAVDVGTTLIRDWLFYSYPALEQIGISGYYEREGRPSILWTPKGVVLTSAVEGDSTRICEYDPCAPASIVFFSFADKKAHTLRAGTGACDYFAVGMEADGVTISGRKLCLASPEAWREHPGDDAPTEPLRIKLP